MGRESELGNIPSVNGFHIPRYRNQFAEELYQKMVCK